MLVLCLLSCDLEKDPIHIRIRNASQYDFTNVEINTGQGTSNYGNIKSGEKTNYKPFELAYRYAYIRLIIDNKEFILQPIDYVGETPLGPGRFTYVITVVDFSQKSLGIDAVKDD